ncbi:hypothetical protein Taro_018092 [Colocasia esculenta]|uniref:Uncharacterized protein n=1 Tax=Colocasia esculenta TaxID=4460 RepID=A0A843UY12_COLES|nr:hypothetical protein [Colocasia esculenta]
MFKSSGVMKRHTSRHMFKSSGVKKRHTSSGVMKRHTLRRMPKSSGVMKDTRRGMLPCGGTNTSLVAQMYSLPCKRPTEAQTPCRRHPCT